MAACATLSPYLLRYNGLFFVPLILVFEDLKPENLLLLSKTDDSSILLADFGFARHVPEDGLKTRCGTVSHRRSSSDAIRCGIVSNTEFLSNFFQPAFVAPEVLVPNCQYNEMADMWSVGCLLYMLLGGM